MYMDLLLSKYAQNHTIYLFVCKQKKREGDGYKFKPEIKISINLIVLFNWLDFSV